MDFWFNHAMRKIFHGSFRTCSFIRDRVSIHVES